MEQAELRPPSIPICRKRKLGIEDMFVDRETVLPRNHKIPTGSGKIGAIGKVVKKQAHYQRDGKRKKCLLFKSSERKTPSTHANGLETATRPREIRKRNVERVLQDLSGRDVDRHLTARTFSAHSCIAHSQWHEFFFFSNAQEHFI